MNRKYSDSLFPWGIGASFVFTLLALIFGGVLAGLFVEPFLEHKNFNQGGGIILLIIILVIVVGPLLYNKKASRFERERTPLKILDYFGVIQGLRGAFIRLLLYDEGIEIRAFYHRYYIPFDMITGVSMERIYFCSGISIKTNIEGMLGLLTLPNQQVQNLFEIIQDNIRHRKTDPAGAKSHKAYCGK